MITQREKSALCAAVTVLCSAGVYHGLFRLTGHPSVLLPAGFCRAA
ncbi:hypothetical protein CLOM621_07554 [Clostridium sp. M62/1]|nr:hypothetical protein CLOM621_07554 [Clostridium sp. M62/1]